MSTEKTVLKADQVNFSQPGSMSVGKGRHRGDGPGRLDNAFIKRPVVITSPSIENNLRIDESGEIIR